MDMLIRLIAAAVDPDILPLLAVYAIPGEQQRQEACGMGC